MSRARQAGHVLVEKDHVHNAVLLQGFEQGSPVGEAGHLVSLALEEEDVRLEQVNLIVGPKDVWGVIVMVPSRSIRRNYFVTVAPVQRNTPIFGLHGRTTQAAERPSSTGSSNSATRISPRWITDGCNACAASASSA